MARGGKGRQYTEEFKQSAIELALSGELSILQVARDLGMSDKTLHNWLRNHKAEHGLVEEKKEDDLETELKRLRKENIRLKQERDILKKATAYFAKDAM